MRTATGSFAATGGEALFDAGRPSLKIHAGGLVEDPPSGAMQAARSPGWALPPADALAISLVVTTAAAGWMLAAVLLTGPVLAAADGLARAVGASRGA